MFKFITAILSVIVVGVMLLVYSAAWANIDNTFINLNQFNNVVASIRSMVASSFTTGHPASNANDGNAGTYWES